MYEKKSALEREEPWTSAGTPGLILAVRLFDVAVVGEEIRRL